jgi:hypothetical protein
LGFAGGFVGSGGDLKAGVQGALTGGLFGAAGTIGAANDPSRYLAHAGAGCISSVAGGGKCGEGAASAVFGKFTSNNINIQNDIGRGIAAVVAGGVGSVIGGGKFANGAETAAYGYLFNQMSMNSIFKAGFHGGSNLSDAQAAAEYKAAAKNTAKEAGHATLEFATSDLVDIGGMALGNTLPGKIVAGVGLVADGINFYTNGKSAGLWGFGAGAALQTVSPAFRVMPEWASSRATAGVAFGIEKGVVNTYEKK